MRRELIQMSPGAFDRLDPDLPLLRHGGLRPLQAPQARGTSWDLSEGTSADSSRPHGGTLTKGGGGTFCQLTHSGRMTLVILVTTRA